MTRVRLLSAPRLATLEVQMHEWFNTLELDTTIGIQSLTYQMDPPLALDTAMVVYGHGPTTTTRWTGVQSA